MLSTTPQQTPTSSAIVPQPESGETGLCVLHVVNSLDLGGTQSLLARVHREQQRRGLDSQVCVLEHAGRTHEKFQALEPSYLDFNGDYRRPWAVRECVSRLRQTIQRVRPDIVHSYLWTSDFITALAVKHHPEICHISEVVDRRGWLASRRWIHRLRKASTNRAFRRANTRFLAVSEAARQYAIEQLQIPTNRIEVAHNGIDAAQFRATQRTPLDSDRPLVVGTTGRLEEEKGHSFLLAAMQELLAQGQKIRLDICGDGRLRSELESLGFSVNQSKLSRVLRKLGATKVVNQQGESIYRLPITQAPLPKDSSVAHLALNVSHNESCILIKTLPGSASLIGHMLDQEPHLDLLGTLAGDDVVLVIPKTTTQISSLQKVIEKLLT